MFGTSTKVQAGVGSPKATSQDHSERQLPTESVMGWIVPQPPHSQVEVLTNRSSDVTIFENRVFKEMLS